MNVSTLDALVRFFLVVLPVGVVVSLALTWLDATQTGWVQRWRAWEDRLLARLRGYSAPSGDD